MINTKTNMSRICKKVKKKAKCVDKKSDDDDDGSIFGKGKLVIGSFQTSLITCLYNLFASDLTKDSTVMVIISL